MKLQLIENMVIKRLVLQCEAQKEAKPRVRRTLASIVRAAYIP